MLKLNINPQFSGEPDSVLLQVGHLGAHPCNLLVYIGQSVVFAVKEIANCPISMASLIAEIHR